MNRERTGVILAAIALPTDSTSAVTAEILGSAFEEKLFTATGAEKESGGIRQFSRIDYLASRVTSLPAAILAKAFRLGGGSYTLDAACASSLYSVKLACDELHAGRADVMLAGGVSRPNSLYTQVGFSQLRALSPSGRCAPFDERADGLVVGEGAGLVVLKRLSDALRDRDPIHGLIHGVGLSNDMRGNLLAPDSEGQLRAMRRAYKATGWSPQDIDLIECHGAGTPLGDLTELNSLTKLWGESGWTRSQCRIGSVKSMIGHLLTAAGAAGMIKTLLAMQHKTLPPSLNFKQPPQNSPLNNGPFRVQTRSEEWQPRSPGRPRRAAVSAFGFGGINAHMLLEEWDPNSDFGLRISDSKTSATPEIEITHSEDPKSQIPYPKSAIAIVGMDAVFGPTASLREFQELIFNGKTNFRRRPAHRWKGCDRVAERQLNVQSPAGGFCDELSISAGEFHIPPREIPDILPQQLFMLKVAAGAMQDAGLPLRQERPDMGAIIGIDFDIEATNFNLRWQLNSKIDQWLEKLDLNPDAEEKHAWLASMKDDCNPPLTATRTLGALGGIVASRVAREFRLGGPSFIVSCEDAGGLKALEIGVRALQSNEAEAFLIGAVDLCGDVRNMVLTNQIRAYSKSRRLRPFDKTADGILTGEGATAMVIKRLDRALADGNRVYAVIRGIGSASGGGLDRPAPSRDAYLRSLQQCCREARISPAAIGLVEAHGSSNPLEDDLESEALNIFFSGRGEPCGVGSVKANIGHTGAASALASVVKTSLSLYQEILPPLVDFTSPKNPAWLEGNFHFPVSPQYWLRDRCDGERTAIVGSMTPDGNCAHVMLEGYEYQPSEKAGPEMLRKVKLERRRPLGFQHFALFAVEGSNRQELLSGLDALDRHAESAAHAADSHNRLPPTGPIEETARTWYLKNGINQRLECAVTIAAADISSLKKRIADAREAILSEKPQKMGRAGGVSYSPHPLGLTGNLAFVFPGSGNHYLGMGRDVGAQWPRILRDMDSRTSRLKTQLIPDCYAPWRVSWEPGWQKSAYRKIIADAHHMIFGQVVHGGVMANLIKHFGVKPSAVIGYSLGESAGYFAMKVWPERGEMLKRMQATNLFKTELAGRCNAARQVWNIPEGEAVDWTVAVVNRSSGAVREVIDRFPTARLLIVNTPEECVIGGRLEDVRATINNLNCEAIFLDGVVTVHCDAVKPVADAYRELHVFPARQPDDIRFYSCALGRAYNITSEKAANSILNQALHGFDFTATVNRAYQDRVRIFLELGPYSSCTRMINRILHGKHHLALSACVRGEQDYNTIIKVLAALIAERIPVDLEALYGDHAYAPAMIAPVAAVAGNPVKVPVGRLIEVGRQMTEDGASLKLEAGMRPPARSGLRPGGKAERLRTEDRGLRNEDGRQKAEGEKNEEVETVRRWEGETEKAAERRILEEDVPQTDTPWSELIEAANQAAQHTADAHQKFLELSSEFTKSYAETFNLQTRLLQKAIAESDGSISSLESKVPESDIAPSMDEPLASEIPQSHAVFPREACMEFAVGSVAKVLGPEFAIVDTYPARVRLPDDPLMLVDRILSVDGQKGSLGPGRIVTEHDVLRDAWYLDGGHAPVCISVEAGQADLFLCSYLGIDLEVKGRRTYRLLDATVKFHRELPLPGETIRYEIEIEKFLRQGQTYLFLFHFNGYIDNMPLITMTNGCAGFFTEDEVQNSGGIILTEDDSAPGDGKRPPGWRDLAPVDRAGYDDASIEALRAGDLVEGFGKDFDGMRLSEALRLPAGRMKLIDRVVNLDPAGGRFGLGIIQAEADIHPDDWFLTCHFVDDMVMPGTLMYECCAHTLRIYMQRIGWVTDKPGVFYEPVRNIEATLKCRGPVTPETGKVIYEIQIKEIGYRPEPYVIADAYMYADGHRIVFFRNMSMQMSGITREEIESLWDNRQPIPAVRSNRSPRPPLFDRSHMLEFAEGLPSRAFGQQYEPYDSQRFIARLPRPPYLLIDRVVNAEPEPWVLKPDGWIEAECNIDPAAWYFKAERTAAAPISIILEIALQPCGWLAAYMGSALRSQNDLRFRNLGGGAMLYNEILPDAGTLTVRARMTNASEAADMIIEHFDFEVDQKDRRIYAGSTYFGFFTREALARQEGIRDAASRAFRPTAEDQQNSMFHEFIDEAPLHPADQHVETAPALALPARAIRMIDRIETYIPRGGPAGYGFIRGTKTVDPREWFFKAHFFQDPVCPGSLGIESFIQLLKFVALQRWPQFETSHRFGLLTDVKHSWVYRGQIVPENKLVTVEAVITEIKEEPEPSIKADGYLIVDGLYIYKMEDFGIKLVGI
jgi:PfaB family protein